MTSFFSFLYSLWWIIWCYLKVTNLWPLAVKFISSTSEENLLFYKKIANKIRMDTYPQPPWMVQFAEWWVLWEAIFNWLRKSFRCLAVLLCQVWSNGSESDDLLLSLLSWIGSYWIKWFSVEKISICTDIL